MAQIVYNILIFTVGHQLLFVNNFHICAWVRGWFASLFDYQSGAILLHLGAAARVGRRTRIRRATRFLPSRRWCRIDDRTIDCHRACLTLRTANIFCLERRCRRLLRCIATVCGGGRGNRRSTIIDCGWSIGRCDFTNCWLSVLETSIQLFCCVISFDWVVICLSSPCGSVPCALPRGHGMAWFSFKLGVIFEDIFVVPLLNINNFPMMILNLIG